jgi:hypothetical protein
MKIGFLSVPLTLPYRIMGGLPRICQEPPPKWQDVIAENPLRANNRTGR